MRDLPRKHRNALRDFYMLEDDDATVCARNGLSLIAWRELKGQVDSLFMDISGIRQPMIGAPSEPGRIARSGWSMKANP
jgi:hypothetical protein